MYRKLVFVLTMFAVAFGSLSQVQTALASSRPAARVASAAHAGTPASIATLRATGAARPATAGRRMAHGARLRTEQKQGSLPLGEKRIPRQSGDRRATGTASAPTTTRAASPAAPKNTRGISAINTACQIFSIPGNATFTVGQSSTVYIFTGLNDYEDFGSQCTFSDGGATLPSGVRFTDTGHNWATLSGTPAAGTAGTYPFTINGSNGGRTVTTLYYTLTVVQACTITSTTDNATFTVGQPGTPVIFTSTGPPTCAWTETGALPTGVAFTDNGDGTATLAGTPAAGTGGTYPFTITATNGFGSAATQSFTLTVDQACQFTQPWPPSPLPPARPGPINVTTTGYPTCAIVRDGRTAVGGHVHRQRGRHRDTCGNTGSGLRRNIHDHDHRHERCQSSRHPDHHPHGRPGVPDHQPWHTTFTAGQAGTFSITTTGPPTCTLTETGALPSGVTFTDNGDGTATLAGPSAPGSSGPYPFTITATNGIGSCRHPGLHAHGQPCARDHQPSAPTPLPSARPGPLPSRRPGCPSAALSETGTLPTGVTFTDNGNGTATLAGTPTTGGTYTSSPSPPRTVSLLTPPRTSPSRSTRRRA